jgi:NADPH:quinone reductase-like Zn-dependent oxidoreductase
MRHKPPSLSFAEAASVPLAAGSAYLVLVKLANIQKGQRVLVNGASGGVGIFAIQIAKALGAFVVCTCSDATRELVESLGPDVVSILDHLELLKMISHISYQRQSITKRHH